MVGPDTKRRAAADEDDEGDEETEKGYGDLDEDCVREDVLVEVGRHRAEVLHGVDQGRQVVPHDELVGLVLGVPEDQLRGVDLVEVFLRSSGSYVRFVHLAEQLGVHGLEFDAGRVEHVLVRGRRVYRAHADAEHHEEEEACAEVDDHQPALELLADDCPLVRENLRDVVFGHSREVAEDHLQQPQRHEDVEEELREEYEHYASVFDDPEVAVLFGHERLRQAGLPSGLDRTCLPRCSARAL